MPRGAPSVKINFVVPKAQQQKRRMEKRPCANCGRQPVKMIPLGNQNVPMCDLCGEVLELARGEEMTEIMRAWHWRRAAGDPDREVILPSELAEVLRESPFMPKKGLLNWTEGLVRAATRKGNWDDHRSGPAWPVGQSRPPPSWPPPRRSPWCSGAVPCAPTSPARCAASS